MDVKTLRALGMPDPDKDYSATKNRMSGLDNPLWLIYFGFLQNELDKIQLVFQSYFQW